MTKKDFQKELNEKVIPGVRPSDLKKKLKRSKSDSDIPKAPSLPNNSDPPNQLLQDQLKEKQTEIESLREQLEVKNEELKTLKTQQSSLLDDNLSLKHWGLKDWFRQYQQTQKLETELQENIDYASEELISQDQTISNLRTKNSKLQQTNQSLQKDLDLAQKLAELRKYPLPDNSNPNYLKYALYSLCAVGFTLWLTNNWKYE